ncbi:MAG: hypothetical protein KAG18_00895 [Sinobacterium sp.]|nr:hypothetical protein [Sinobacterium sp.]
MWKLLTVNVVVALSLMSSVVSAAAVARLSEAEKSFSEFTELASLNSTDIAKLYADDARIEFIVMDGWSLIQATMLSGTQYKQRLSGKSADTSELFNAQSEFRDIDFFTNGPRIGFFAVRYSHQNCVTDDQYFVIFERGEDNQYRIVRERIETAPNNLCGQKTATNADADAAPVGVANFNYAAQNFEEENPFVAQMTLDKIAKQLENNPPGQLDANTEFVGFLHQDSTITYTHRLSQYQSNPKYNNLLKHVTKASLVRTTCHNQRLVQVLNYQGEIKYDYQDKLNADIFELEINTQDCDKLAQAESSKTVK